jgi:hypothetical protein
MYGTRGTNRRRRIVYAEFIAGACACSLLGILALVTGSLGWVLFGAWLVGVGINCVAMALEAGRLSRPGALEAEMAGLELRQELRSATKAQLWIAVPFAVCLAAVSRARPS